MLATAKSVLDSAAEFFGRGIEAEANTPTVNLEAPIPMPQARPCLRRKMKFQRKQRITGSPSKLPVIKKVGAVKWEKCDTLG